MTESQHVAMQDDSLEKKTIQPLITYCNAKKEGNIVVVGKTGAGKSSLVNSLLLRTAAIVGPGPSPNHQPYLQKHMGKLEDMTVSVYDTRGFGSIENAGTEGKRLLEQLRIEFSQESGRKIDVFIFCQEMFERFETGNMNALTQFGGLLIENGWKVSIVALTKANLLPINVIEADDRKTEMEKVRDSMKVEMQEKYFQQHGLLEVSERIPFIPVGCRTEKTDLSQLPCSDNSIGDIVEQCIMRCNLEVSSTLTSVFINRPLQVVYLGDNAGDSDASIPTGTLIKRIVIGAVKGAEYGGTAGGTLGTLMGRAAGIQGGEDFGIIVGVTAGAIAGAAVEPLRDGDQETVAQYLLNRFIVAHGENRLDRIRME